MFRNFKVIGLIGSAILAIAAIFVWLTSAQAPQRDSVSTKAGASEKNATAVSTGRTIDQANASATAMPILNNSLNLSESSGRMLVKLYSTSTDKRKLFDEARQHPQDGGAFLANKLALECSTNKPLGAAGTIEKKNKLVPLDAPDRAMRLDAIRKLHEPCAGFDISPVDFKALSELFAEGVKAGDPVLKVQSDLRNVFSDKGDLSNLPGILKAASEANNPYVIQEAVSSLVINANKTGLAINDHQIVAADAQALIIASSLVACQFGLDCSSNSRGALEYCTGGSSCGSDLYELVRQDGLPPNEFNRAMTFHNQLVEMFRTGNFSGISVKPKAPPVK